MYGMCSVWHDEEDIIVYQLNGSNAMMHAGIQQCQEVWHISTLQLVHKRMSISTFEGLSTTFEASTNVYFTYFCHKIICYSDYTCIKVASKMLTSNNQAVKAHIQLHCAYNFIFWLLM